MAESRVTLLNKLSAFKDDSTIKVRIIHLWRQPVKNNPKETFSMDMILMDEQGNKIHASVLKKIFDGQETLLVVKGCVLIKYPMIGQIYNKYKVVDNPQKVSFSDKTKVTKCEDFGGSLYGFNFTSFDLLHAKAIDNQPVDVIGLIVSYYKGENIIKKDGSSCRKMSLMIQDLNGKKVSLTLWDTYADQISNYLTTKEDDGHVVIILQFGYSKIHDERTSVSNSFNHSRLFINENIDEILHFKQSLEKKNQAHGASSSSVITGPSMLMSFHDDFVFQTEFKHVAEIDGIDTQMSFVIFGTIIFIPRDVKWYYHACKFCNKMVNPVNPREDADGSNEPKEKQIFKCNSPKCGGKVVDAIIRYKIILKVQDTTGVVDLVLWDREAKKILKKTANELLQEILSAPLDSDLFPDDFKNLIDQRFGFKVEITKYNLDNNYKIYTISKLTQDKRILCELQKKLNIDEENSDSLACMSGEFKCEDTINRKEKDVVSVTEDNATPVSNQTPCKNTTVFDREDESTAALKRNLVDIYDDDEVAGHSSTISRTFSGVYEKSNEKQKLLIPKTEK